MKCAHNGNIVHRTSTFPASNTNKLYCGSILWLYLLLCFCTIRINTWRCLCISTIKKPFFYQIIITSISNGQVKSIYINSVFILKTQLHFTMYRALAHKILCLSVNLLNKINSIDSIQYLSVNLKKKKLFFAVIPKNVFKIIVPGLHVKCECELCISTAWRFWNKSDRLHHGNNEKVFLFYDRIWSSEYSDQSF